MAYRTCTCCALLQHTTHDIRGSGLPLRLAPPRNTSTPSGAALARRRRSHNDLYSAPLSLSCSSPTSSRSFSFSLLSRSTWQQHARVTETARDSHPRASPYLCRPLPQRADDLLLSADLRLRGSGAGVSASPLRWAASEPVTGAPAAPRLSWRGRRLCAQGRRPAVRAFHCFAGTARALRAKRRRAGCRCRSYRGAA